MRRVRLPFSSFRSGNSTGGWVAPLCSSSSPLRSRRTRAWPAVIWAPSVMHISLTVPSPGDSTSISIFMASRTTRTSPLLTLSPAFTGTDRTMAGEGGLHISAGIAFQHDRGSVHFALKPVGPVHHQDVVPSVLKDQQGFPRAFAVGTDDFRSFVDDVIAFLGDAADLKLVGVASGGQVYFVSVGFRHGSGAADNG